MEEIQEVKWTSTPTEMTSKMETESCTAPALETNENRKVDRKRFFFKNQRRFPLKEKLLVEAIVGTDWPPSSSYFFGTASTMPW